MIKVGITGEMGSGKTFISKLFSNIGIPVYNCDKNAKLLVTTNDGLKSDIKKYFGENIYDGDVFKNLSSLVFTKDENSVKNLKILTDLIYPYLYKDIDDFCEKNDNKVYCLIESAVLYENKMENNLDLVIYVSAFPDVRLKRAMERDKITKEDYNNRMKTQISPEVKKTKANYLIYNNGETDLKDRISIIDSSINTSYLIQNHGLHQHNDVY